MDISSDRLAGAQAADTTAKEPLIMTGLTGGVGIIAFIAAFAALIGMRFAVRRSMRLTVGLLGAFGLLRPGSRPDLNPTIGAWTCARPSTASRPSRP